MLCFGYAGIQMGCGLAPPVVLSPAPVKSRQDRGYNSATVLDLNKDGPSAETLRVQRIRLSMTEPIEFRKKNEPGRKGIGKQASFKLEERAYI